jgi:hypothetical protein
MHFAARWCAKEAFKKCAAEYEQIDLKHIEVALERSGAPFLQYRANDGIVQRLPVSLSLTHTQEMAAAIVVKLQDSYASDISDSRVGDSSSYPTPLDGRSGPPQIESSHRRISWVAPFLTGCVWVTAIWVFASLRLW